MFAGKFDSIIPLDKEEQIEAIKKIRQILEEGKEHRYTNLEIVLLKTIEDQLKEIESLKNRTAKVQVKLQEIMGIRILVLNDKNRRMRHISVKSDSGVDF